MVSVGYTQPQEQSCSPYTAHTSSEVHFSSVTSHQKRSRIFAGVAEGEKTSPCKIYFQIQASWNNLLVNTKHHWGNSWVEAYIKQPSSDENITHLKGITIHSCSIKHKMVTDRADGKWEREMEVKVKLPGRKQHKKKIKKKKRKRNITVKRLI